MSTEKTRIEGQELLNLLPPAPPSAILLGWTPRELDLDAMQAVIEFTATEEFLNPFGSVQGGILAAMLDDTMGPLAYVLYRGECAPTTTDLHTQYFKAAKPGKFTCTARITRRGRRVCYTSAELCDADGNVVASAIQTAQMVELRKDR